MDIFANFAKKYGMTHFNTNDYPDILRFIVPTSDDIKHSAENSGYQPLHFSNPYAEKCYHIEMTSVFYRFTLRYNRIPTVYEFWGEIITEYSLNGIFLGASQGDYFRGLEARAKSRTYPSLVRDIHFAKLLAESPLAQRFNVHINPKLDLNGIDVLLHDIKESRFYGVCLYQDTVNSQRELEDRKRKKRKIYDNLFYKELPLEAQMGNMGIWLYSEDDITTLGYELLNYPTRNFSSIPLSMP